MNPFKSDPEKKLQRDIVAARAARDKLVGRLATAESLVTERRAGAQRQALDGVDDATLDAAEAAQRGAEDRVKTLAAALVEAERRLVNLESELAGRLDQTLRAETAATVEKLTIEIEGAAREFDTSAGALAECAHRVGLFILDARGLENFAVSARGEVPAAVEMISGILRSYATQVIAGQMPAVLPKPEAPQVHTPVPAPLLTRVFLLKPAKWTDHMGSLRISPAFVDADLPAAAAARALSARAATPMGSESQKQLRGTRQISRPDPSRCVDLDADIESANSADPEPHRGRTEIHSAFEHVDRGPPFVIKVPREAA
jgi:hypothetical protein